MTLDKTKDPRQRRQKLTQVFQGTSQCQRMERCLRSQVQDRNVNNSTWTQESKVILPKGTSLCLNRLCQILNFYLQGKMEYCMTWLI